MIMIAPNGTIVGEKTSPTGVTIETTHDKTVTGTPEIKSIDVIRFGPGGVLLIGDGKGSQVFAVDVGGTEEKAGFKDSIERIDAKIAAKLGGTTKEVEIVDLAVNPSSHVGFIAVRKQGKPILLTIDGSGNLGLVGEMRGSVNLGGQWLTPGKFEFFVAAFSISGNSAPVCRWSKYGTGTTTSSGSGVAFDTQGHIVTGGSISMGTIDFGGTSATSTGTSAAFVAQYVK